MPAVIRRTAVQFFIRALPDGDGGPAPRVDLSQRVTSLTYSDEEKRADKLSLVVDNWDLALFDDPAFVKGMLLEVTWGYANNMAPPRVCVVQRISGGTELRVEALAESILLHRDTRSRTFENVRRSDVARRIAREAGGFSDDRIDVEETPVIYPRIAQNGMTDAQLLVHMARREGFEFYVDHTGFHWHRRRVGEPPVRILHYFTDPNAGDVVDFTIDNDITAKPGRVRRRGRNPLEGEDIDESADDESDRERTTLSPLRIIVDPETRARRTEVRTGSEETRPTTATTAAGARREAVGRFRRVQQTAIKMKMNVIGDPSLLAKTVVEVRGMGQRLSTRYFVRSVQHSIAGDGYSCALEMVSDGDGGHSTESRVARGLELLNPGPETRARPNTAEPAPGAERSGGAEEGEPLQPRIVVDPETRERRTEYRDRRGSGGGS